jgi:lipopolysaccharide biosynthesis regulator YciM
MNEEEIVEQLVNGETLSGSDAVEAFAMLKREGWRFGVRLARLFLERGEIENAKTILDALLEEPSAKGEEEK